MHYALAVLHAGPGRSDGAKADTGCHGRVPGHGARYSRTGNTSACHGAFAI
jgi:hypothetical protein